MHTEEIILAKSAGKFIERLETFILDERIQKLTFAREDEEKGTSYHHFLLPDQMKELKEAIMKADKDKILGWRIAIFEPSVEIRGDTSEITVHCNTKTAGRIRKTFK